MAVLVTTRLLPVFKSNRFMHCPQLIVSCPALDRWPLRRYCISSGVLDRSPHRAHALRIEIEEEAALTLGDPNEVAR